jgi:hypothetical protein
MAGPSKFLSESRSRFEQSLAAQQVAALWAIPPAGNIVLDVLIPHSGAIGLGPVGGALITAAASLLVSAVLVGLYIVLDATRAGRGVALPAIFVASSARFAAGLGMLGPVLAGLFALAIWVVAVSRLGAPGIGARR